MIKAIIFDFDGTLCNLVDVHYQALNQAIEKVAGRDFIILPEEQKKVYNGLSTKTKLKLLIQNKKLPESLADSIDQLKQQYTLKYIDQLICKNESLYQDLIKLKEKYLLYCASNAMYQTVKLGLEKLGIFNLFDYVVGNDNISNQKPAPDIYLSCFKRAKLQPNECLIVEDSDYGKEAAIKSGGYLCAVDNPEQTTYKHIKNCIDNISCHKLKWFDKKLNVVIPMSGMGKRFKEKNPNLPPKPLIDVHGAPMIQRVVESLNIEANYIFIVQKAHYEEYNLQNILNNIVSNCTILQVDRLTEGAACTSLLAKDLINDCNPLLIVNSDQLINYDNYGFFNSIKYDAGGILTFEANEEKWSYAKTNNDNFVEQVAEKIVISNQATVGIYWFAKGSEYVKYAEQMISKNIRTKGEFYICPVYNEYIQDNKKIKTYPVIDMMGIGTPEDLEIYLTKQLHN